MGAVKRSGWAVRCCALLGVPSASLRVIRCVICCIAQAERDELGSPPNQELLEALKPRYWFSAHLHCKFPAIVPHQHTNNFQQQQQWEGLGNLGGSGSSNSTGQAAAASGSGNGSDDGGPDATRFLALDKCLPGRDFLQVGGLIKLQQQAMQHISDDH